MAPVAPNGWISVDLGWIWVGYVQYGLFGSFGPTEIAPGGLQREQKWPKNAIKCAFLAIGGSSVNVYQLGRLKETRDLVYVAKT